MCVQEEIRKQLTAELDGKVRPGSRLLSERHQLTTLLTLTNSHRKKEAKPTIVVKLAPVYLGPKNAYFLVLQKFIVAVNDRHSTNIISAYLTSGRLPNKPV